MTGTCQSVKGSCNLFIEPQLTSFLVLYNFLHVFKIFTTFLKFFIIIWYDDTSYQENSGSITRSLDADTRNTTSVKMTSYKIL